MGSRDALRIAKAALVELQNGVNTALGAIAAAEDWKIVFTDHGAYVKGDPENETVGRWVVAYNNALRTNERDNYGGNDPYEVATDKTDWQPQHQNTSGYLEGYP